MHPNIRIYFLNILGSVLYKLRDFITNFWFVSIYRHIYRKRVFWGEILTVGTLLFLLHWRTIHRGMCFIIQSTMESIIARKNGRLTDHATWRRFPTLVRGVEKVVIWSSFSVTQQCKASGGKWMFWHWGTQGRMQTLDGSWRTGDTVPNKAETRIPDNCYP